MLATYAFACRQFGGYVPNPSLKHVPADAVGTRFFVAQRNFPTIPADSTYSIFVDHECISQEFASYSALSTYPLFVVYDREPGGVAQILKRPGVLTSTRRCPSSIDEAI
jgi:hypothetical protein